MRRNQLPPHPVLRLMFLLNTLNQSSLRKMTLHPVIIIFLSGPPFFFFQIKNFTFWEISEVTFVVGSTSTRSISILFSLLFEKDSFVENAREHGAHRFWSAYNICSNNMYLFFKYDCTIDVCLEELALGNWVPPNPSLLSWK